ncbi:MAG: N-acetylmuramoyl-L-alanine amidase [Clostridiales bacterium]|jgi:N-acetylmuramoyl-L-alanine amidase|nr:N-acetylmuramoyl-L-alanine amidase [Clostridiales bacterium]
MKITDALLTTGAVHGRPGKAITPKGIVVHYVGNPNTSAMANRNYFENGGNQVSSHYIVGLSGEIIRCIPETEIAWHAGVAYGNAFIEQAKKNNSIYYGIENCHPDQQGKFNNKTRQSLVELCADMCVRHGFDPMKSIYTHNEVTGKTCPVYYTKNPSEWLKLKNDINEYMQKSNLPEGYINLTVDGINYEVEAKNIAGRFYISLNLINQIMENKSIVSIRDVLEANDYTVTWNERLQRITGVKKEKSFKNMSGEE